MLERLGQLAPTRQRLLLLITCLLLFCVWPGQVPLTERDEVRFSEASREMVESGDYLIPHFNYLPRYQKPILIYWLQSASMRVFGKNEVAARLPSAVAGILLVLLVHGFLLHWLPASAGEDERRRQRARGAALLGALALATMPFTAVWARAATTDATLTLFISTALLALLQADLESSAAGARRWYLLAALAGALAFLTKGPVGVVIPALVWFIYYLSRRELLPAIKRTPWVAMLVVFVLIAAPWFIATYIVDGPEFLRHFFLRENLQRYTTTKEGHGTQNLLLGLFTFPLLSLVFLFPFSAVLVRDLIAPPVSATSDHAARIRRFAWVWLACVIGFFSLSRTQLPQYIHSIAGAAALLFALHLLSRVEHPAEADGMFARRQHRAAFSELFVLLLIGIGWIGGLCYTLTRPTAEGAPLKGLAFPQPLTQHITWLLAGLGVLFLAGILFARARQSVERYSGWLVGGWGVLFTFIMLAVVPLYLHSAYGNSLALSGLLRSLPTTEPVWLYHIHTSESLVYYGHRRVTFHEKDRGAACDALPRILASGPMVTCVTNARGLALLRQHARIQQITRAGDYCLVRLTGEQTSPAGVPDKDGL